MTPALRGSRPIPSLPGGVLPPGREDFFYAFFVRGPYRRKLVVMEEQPLSPFQSALQRVMNGVQGQGGGVRVTEIVEDDSPFKLVYDPTHPDANEQGYVELPNVDTVLEMADAMAANQALSADITAFNVLKTVAAKGLEIGK